MVEDMETAQQHQGKKIIGAEAAARLGGGDIDDADAQQQNSEFRIGVTLHSTGCRWPDNTSSSELRSWSEEFWVSLAVVLGESAVSRVSGEGSAASFGGCSSLYLWLRLCF